MKRFLKRSAFTIVEMVIVIAVIGILATVMIPTISGMIERANKSADTQFAASLTIQLAMHSVNGGINSEEDLREAFKEFYDEDYYDTKLVPKAAKSGNHFWYDVETGAVVAATYEKLLSDNPKDPTQLSIGTITMDASGGAVAANITQNNFEAANPRTITLDSETHNGKTFFLMDCGGSAVVDYLADLKDVVVGGQYDNLIGYISEITGADKDLSSAILTNLSKTAIVNGAGMFVGGATVKQVYIPYGVGELGQDYYVYENSTADFSAVESIQIPSGVVVGSNSLDMFSSAVTVYANATSDTEVKAMFGAYAFGNDNYGAGNNNCVIVLPNGDHYIVEQTEVKKLGANGEYESVGNVGFSNPVNDFQIDYTNDNANAANKLYMDAQDSGTILYVAYNYLNTQGNAVFQLSAKDFVGKDSGKDVSSEQVMWSPVDNEYINVTADGQITIKKAPAVGGTYAFDVTATAVAANTEDGKGEKTFTVYIVIPTGFAVNGGNTIEISFNGSNYNHNLTVEEGSYTYNQPGMVDLGLEVIFDETNGPVFAVDTEGNITLKNPVVEGTQTVTARFGTVTKEIVVTVTDNSTMPIEIADNADTQENYGLMFHVGNSNPIKLGTLFKEVEALNGKTVEVIVWDNEDADGKWYEANGSSGGVSYTLVSTDADWKNWTIKFTGTGEAKLEVKVGSKSAEPLYVKVVAAYNVSNATEWLDVPDNNGIAVLKPFNFNGVDSTKTTVTGSFTTGTTWISKNIGGKTIYGNLNKIEFNTFLIKVKSSNNYFLYMSSGTLDHVIIDGPEYTKASNSRTDSTSSSGYYVAGVEVVGNSKIKNSYIAGFRSPLRVDSGNISVTDTTLVGGAFANIYVAQAYSASKTTLTNVNTVQAPGLHGSVGAGIYVDEQSKGYNPEIVFAGNTTQYNWMYEDGDYGSQANSVVGALFAGSGCGDDKTYDYSRFFHNIGGTDYANAGLAFEKSVDKTTITMDSSYTGISYCANADRASYSGWYVISYLSCGDSCSHNLIPDANGDGSYTIDDFLYSKQN